MPLAKSFQELCPSRATVRRRAPPFGHGGISDAGQKVITEVLHVSMRKFRKPAVLRAVGGGLMTRNGVRRPTAAHSSVEEKEREPRERGPPGDEHRISSREV